LDEKRNEWKKTSSIRYDNFEHNVMPFGLTNVLAILQHMMNDDVWEELDDYIIIYLDAIFIFFNKKNMSIMLDRFLKSYANKLKSLYKTKKVLVLPNLNGTFGLYYF